jgi:hypothetical protein
VRELQGRLRILFERLNAHHLHPHTYVTYILLSVTCWLWHRAHMWQTTHMWHPPPRPSLGSEHLLGVL